jgi:hypothetical protein
VRKDGASYVHHAKDVDVELLFHLLNRQRFKDAEETESGVIDKGIDHAKMHDTCVDGRANAG